MKLFKIMKDGGKESKVWGFFAVEIKRLFSVVLLRFEDGSRDAYHSHAFNSVSWVLKGSLTEHRFGYNTPWVYTPSLRPVRTDRSNMHRVVSVGNTYVLSFRGPWINEWLEYIPATNEYVLLTHGRKELDRTEV
jgi:hypothetical protein